MSSQLSLIVSEQHVPRASLRPVRGRSPSVAVVYATAAGEVDLVDGGKPLTYSGQLFSRYRTRYEVDVSDQHRTAELQSSPPPSSDGAHFFEAKLSVHFRVTDPARIVVLNVRNGLAPVYDYLIDTCRAISRGYDIENADGVEVAVNDHFRVPRVLPQGITIFACTARILPDRAALAFLEQRRAAIRATERRAGEDIGRIRETQVINLLEDEKQRGKLAREAAERQALGDRPLTIEEMIRVQLARDPGSSAQILETMLQLQRERSQHELQMQRDQQYQAERQADRDQKQLGMLVENNLVRPNHIAQLLPGASRGPAAQATPRPAAGWDDPLPTASPAVAGPPVLPPAVVPVYLVVEQSIAGSVYLDEVNAALTATVTTLGQPDGGVGDVVRLSVVSYSEAHYATAFQQLLTRIPDDVQQLKLQTAPVTRPLVFFLAGAPPVDGPAWSDLHLRLLNPNSQPYPPEIIVGGIGSVQARTVASIASLPQYAFVSTDPDLGHAVRQYFAYVTAQIQARARAVLAGRADSEYRRPEGFRTADELTPRDERDSHA